MQIRAVYIVGLQKSKSQYSAYHPLSIGEVGFVMRFKK